MSANSTIRTALQLAVLLGGQCALYAQAPVLIRLTENEPPHFRVENSTLLYKINNPNFRKIFRVSVITPNGASVEPIDGEYSMDYHSLVFKPKYKLEPGVSYRAVFKLANEAGAADVTVPKPVIKPTTFVERVYPTSSLLPENQLKFYIHFSAPMSRGEAAKRIHLTEEGVGEVKLAFLDIDEELWDRDQKRLTILFDPGRIKTGVTPNQEVGMALKEGKEYTLLVDAEWKDASGIPLKETFRKKFRAGPADRKPIDPSEWQLALPQAGTSNALVVNLPEPLDAPLLRSFIDVNDEKGNLVRGRAELGTDERSWIFKPEQSWPAGKYSLEILKTLEDLAGNKIGRAFEVDRVEGATPPDSTATYSLTFSILP